MTIHDILIDAINNLPPIKKLSIGDLFNTEPIGVVMRSLTKKQEEGIHIYPNIDSSLRYRAWSALKCEGETIYYLAVSNKYSYFMGLDKRYAFFAITDKGIYCNYEKNSDCELCISWTSIKSLHTASRNGGFAEVIQINDIYGNKHELWPVMMGIECKSSIIQGFVNWLQNISNRIKQLRVTEIFQEFEKEYLRGNYYKAVQLASHIEAMGYEKIARNKQNAINKYIDHFGDIPAESRKIIVIDSKFSYLKSTLFYVLPCENLPQCIKFSTLPMEGNLYIQHPHIINYYIPYANKKTEIELFESKLRELREILLALGASRIEIIHDRKYLTQKEREASFKVDVDGHFPDNNINIRGGGEYVEGCNSYEELAHRYETVFTNNKIVHTPYIPTDLVWLRTEPEWQSLINKRMKGEFTSASFCVSNNKLNRLDERTEMALKMDYSKVLAVANISANYGLKEMLRSEESITWRLNVEFVPLNTKDSKRQNTATDAPEKK